MVYNETFSLIFKTVWQTVKTGLIGGFCAVVFGSDLCYTFKSELEISFVFPPRSSAPISPIVSDASTEKSTNFWSFWPRFARTATASTRQLPQCLKITEKVSFNIASEASYVFILSRQYFIKNAKIGHFGEFLKTWSLRSKSVTRQLQF